MSEIEPPPFGLLITHHSSLITFLLNSDCPIDHREFQGRATCARTRLDCARSDSRFLARLEARITIVDLSLPQHVGIDIAVETGRHFYIQFAGGKLNLEAGSAPTACG